MNKKVEYALMALKFMDQRQNCNETKLTTAREICDHFKTPFDTVAKVMQSLNAHDILSSVKGIKGGYELKVDLSNLTYKQIENIIEGKDVQHFCQGKKGLCDLYSTCNIIGPVEKLNAHVNSFLENLTLRELLEDNGEHHNERN
ncbi:Rrf2 family transcriptional regulator [Bacteriovorax sp. Seq25_V]|uniref:RrF2 family transcriptional regulator n=1 Tax=Bacteriovorax sp. Seq25_V TaxID=1201288 RepID=UPI001E533DC0|nr:Rrf2 family transcriptional regulator [Bacteriovorax sp. Seq25_V]